jgi:cbb3-type cytochrome oxidase subunit 3
MFLVFVAIVIWAYSARNHERFAQAARLPLDDDCDIDDRAVHGRVSRP